MSRRKGGGEDGKGTEDPPVKKGHPFRDPDPDQNVGPGNPPGEYQWPVGHSGNYAGRPRKKVIETSFAGGVNPLQRMILDHANKDVGEFNGEQLTRFERFLKLLDARAHDQPVIAKALLALYVAADRENSETGVKVLAAAIDYKEKHEAAFARATMAKRRPPPIYPHPDDVIIHSNGTVHIDGPVTAQGARELEKVMLYCDLLILVAEEVLDCPKAPDRSSKHGNSGRHTGGNFIAYTGEYLRGSTSRFPPSELRRARKPTKSRALDHQS